MTERYGHLREVLDGYAKFLQDKNLALDKHQPYLVRWVHAIKWLVSHVTGLALVT